MFGLHEARVGVTLPMFIDDFLSFLDEIIIEIGLQQTISSNLVVDLNIFVNSEQDELYFAALSRMLRTSGHKLKSKLKPENIGLHLEIFCLLINAL